MAVLSSIVGPASINLSYSDLDNFKKSLWIVRLDGSNANSIDIFLHIFPHETPAILCPSINSATFKKFCNVEIIPAKIFTPPTIADASDFFSADTKESIPTFAAPVNVDNTITGIEKQ